METYVWILIVFGLAVLDLLAGILHSAQNTAAMTRRLLAHHHIEWGVAVEPSAQVKDLARNRKTRIAAIKAYREQTGLGLREAKAVVDELSRPGHGIA